MSSGDQTSTITIMRTTGQTTSTFQPHDLREWVCTSASGFLLLVVLSVVTIVAFYQSQYNACSTTECLEYGRLFASSVNPNVNPCVNFYQFVCDGWDRSNNQSVQEVHLHDFLRELSETLNSVQVPPKDQSSVEKAAKFYQSCIDVTSGKRNEDDEFKELLRKGNVTWPVVEGDGDLLQVMTYAAVHWNVQPLLDFRKTVVTGDAVVVGITPGTVLSIWYRERLKLIERKSYRDYHKKVFTIISGSETNASEFHNFEMLENNIFKSLIPALNRESTGILTEEEFKAHSTAFSYPRWKKVFEELLEISPSKSITFALTNTAFFDAFNEVTLDVGERNMILITSWCVLFALGHLMIGGLSTALYNNPQDAESTARIRCLHHVEPYMGVALSAPYVTEVVSSQVYVDVRNLTETLVEHMSRKISKRNALYTDTARNFDALFLYYDKLTNISDLDRVFSHFPDMGTRFTTNHIQAVAAWRKRSAEDTSYFGSYLHVRDYYNLYRKNTESLVIWPVALTPPFFAADIPFALRYGALGWLVAAARAEVIIRDVSWAKRQSWGRTVTELPSCLSGKSTSKSIFYKTISGSVVWEAFRKAGGTGAEPGTSIDGFSEYSPDQLFFIAMCYLQCGRGKPGHEEYCNGVLKNLEPFSMAFNCSSGSPMNPSRKCNVM
ncbi:phosphate-regulating neutral endopeptidase PHEX-like [Ornithodoros turicata]|uniref:phosphate-regulating neutral endopeptidase PHEX-like n=1 Tax=Ornithodoros turicata TaxID=34597 RepID=UPI00313A45BE